MGAGSSKKKDAEQKNIKQQRPTKAPDKAEASAAQSNPPPVRTTDAEQKNVKQVRPDKAPDKADESVVKLTTHSVSVVTQGPPYTENVAAQGSLSAERASKVASKEIHGGSSEPTVAAAQSVSAKPVFTLPTTAPVSTSKTIVSAPKTQKPDEPITKSATHYEDDGEAWSQFFEVIRTRLQPNASSQVVVFLRILFSIPSSNRLPILLEIYTRICCSMQILDPLPFGLPISPLIR
jgi:hypothetical protein